MRAASPDGTPSAAFTPAPLPVVLPIARPPASGGARWRGALLPVLLLIFAEAALRLHPVPSDTLAAPSQVVAALGRAAVDGSLWLASLQTLAAALGGLAIGVGLGLAAGVAFGLSRRAAAYGALSVELLKPVPSVALIPVAMMVFGFGFRLEIAVVAFTTTFPMAILTQAAVRAVPARLLEVSAVLGLSRWQRVAKIVLPAALPRIFVAFRLSVGIALVVAITTEVATNPQGLGYGMISAQQSLAPDTMLALLFWVGLLGWGSSALLLAAEKRWFGAFGRGGAA